MTGDLDTARVIIAAGGLGTRAARWTRYLPKEYQPVAGRPAITHLLDEVSALCPACVAIVYHPYYEIFALWARQALSRNGRTRYQQAAGKAPALGRHGEELRIDLIPQRGAYGDLTSLFEGSDHLANVLGSGSDSVHFLFADNLYPGTNPLVALQNAPVGVAVLARPYEPELTAQRGVIIATAGPLGRRMHDLIEKPDDQAARALERRYGTATLWCSRAGPASRQPSRSSPVSTLDHPKPSPNLPWPLAHTPAPAIRCILCRSLAMSSTSESRVTDRTSS
jgi:UTP-glucose-1-phosphate uridylyltransferase